MVKKKRPLSVRKLRAIDILASPDSVNLKNDEIGAQVGVTGKTISNWKCDPQFQDALQARIRKYAASLLPYAWECLRERMPKDTQALKLYYQLLGEYKEQMELSGPAGSPMTFKWLREVDESELEELEKELD